MKDADKNDNGPGSYDLIVLGAGSAGFSAAITGADGGSMLIGGANIAFNISQVGNGNIVEGSFISDSGSVSVTQMGDWNTAVIVQQ